MRLVSAQIGPYKSIDKAQTVEIQPKITVLVGMNEAGKTVFLETLQKSDDVLDKAEFAPVDDCPRKDLTTYMKRHKDSPQKVTALKYQLTDAEVASVNKVLGTALPKGFQFAIETSYANSRSLDLIVEEKPVIAALASTADLSTDVRNAIKNGQDHPRNRAAVREGRSDRSRQEGSCGDSGTR